jgi:hypothetical protein
MSALILFSRRSIPQESVNRPRPERGAKSRSNVRIGRRARILRAYWEPADPLGRSRAI